MQQRQINLAWSIAALCALVAVLVNAVLVGKAVKLPAAAALTGVVSQALGTSANRPNLPVPGSDFTLSNVAYFENGQWAGVTISPKRGAADKTVALLHQVNGTYFVVAGPGTAFPSDYNLSLPGDVNNYLNNQAAVYEPVAN